MKLKTKPIVFKKLITFLNVYFKKQYKIDPEFCWAETGRKDVIHSLIFDVYIFQIIGKFHRGIPVYELGYYEKDTMKLISIKEVGQYGLPIDYAKDIEAITIYRFTHNTKEKNNEQ